MRRFREFIAAEKEKLEGKSRREKIAYIWDYYKLWIIAIVCALSLIFYLSYRIRTTLKDHWFYITFANTRAEVGTGSALWEGYLDYTGYDTTVKLVEFNNASYFDYTKNRARGNSYYEVFLSYVDAGVLDAVTMESDALTLLGESGWLLDLNSDAARSIREKYGDRFLYCTPIDTEYSTEPVPVGIDISDSRLVTEYHVYVEPCSLGIGAKSQNLEAVELFLDYIYEEE